MERFHPLESTADRPTSMVSPFCYEPHPLCKEAAERVRLYVERHADLLTDANRGKMMGVLVAERQGELGFLAAYSGLLAGRNDWPWFVPPIFDAQQPDGHFKQEEHAITELNHQIAALENSEELKAAQQRLATARQQAARDVEMMRKKTLAAKALRDMQRLQRNIAPEERAALVRESQFMKAELHRLKKRVADAVGQCEAEVATLEQRLKDLKEERRQQSDALQHWLFAQYIIMNARGETMTLPDIFGTEPPSGSGDCCAPKLLQYAFENGLRPLCLAEFWWGESPKGEVRHHMHFYPPCRSRCLPILKWMGVVENEKEGQSCDAELITLFEDDYLAVVNKPAGMLSVPGMIDRPSVEEVMRRHWHQNALSGSENGTEWNPLIVHRLDMETSGLMVVARTKAAHAALQRQFLERRVQKHYIAVVDGVVSGSGVISLPLRPDLADRPRQLVDSVHGREAVTRYEVLSVDGLRSRLLLTPETGRTHQLRVHCAHRDGLNAPIVGDELYGRKGDRLLLHAAHLAFCHPVSGDRLSFDSEPDF